jgi:hypothetical protein
MKTFLFISVTFLSFNALVLNVAAAQNDALLESGLASNSRPTSEVPDHSPMTIPEPTMLTVSNDGQTISLNYSIPAFTYSAAIVISDFTGRTLKTIQVNPNLKNRNSFYVADLLSGTYQYTLILDNQKKINGEFTLAD